MNTNIDFDIFETSNPKTLALIDTSHYHVGDSLTNTKVTFLCPGFTSFVEIKFNPKKINVFNSNNLGFTSVTSTDQLQNLSDGIYNIKLTGTLNLDSFTIEKNYLRVNNLLSKYENVVLSIDFDSNDNDSLISTLKEIEVMIYAAIANANNCNIKKATDLYRLASKALSKISDCCKT